MRLCRGYISLLGVVVMIVHELTISLGDLQMSQRPRKLRIGLDPLACAVGAFGAPFFLPLIKPIRNDETTPSLKTGLETRLFVQRFDPSIEFDGTIILLQIEGSISTREFLI